MKDNFIVVNIVSDTVICDNLDTLKVAEDKAKSFAALGHTTQVFRAVTGQFKSVSIVQEVGGDRD